MSAWYANHIRAPLAGAPGLECWFAHPKPADTTEYERAFEGAGLRFAAPCYGFAFDREYLEAPLPCADAIPSRPALRARAADADPVDPAADAERPGPRDRVERAPRGRPDRLHRGSRAPDERANPCAQARARGNDLQRAARQLAAGARSPVRDPPRARVHGDRVPARVLARRGVLPRVQALDGADAPRRTGERAGSPRLAAS